MRTRNGESIWDNLKKFINDHIDSQKKFTRKDMFNYVYPEIAENFHWGKVYTLDTYRAYLSKVKILDFSEKSGIYIKLRDIPDDLKLNKLKQIANDKSWKSWFIPLDEKL